MTTFNSLVTSSVWHNGSGTIFYSYLNTVPSYYTPVDGDGDSINDSREVADTYIPFSASVALSAVQMQLNELAVGAWNAVADLNLVRGTRPGAATGDMTFGSHAFTTSPGGPVDTGLFGFSFFPGTLGVLTNAGDTWYNDGNPSQNVNEYGHTSWNTFLHEIGHGLGLSHPDNDPNNTAGDATNNNQWTVMSYVEHPSVSGLPLDQTPWPLTPMIYDIQAIQSMYGANTAHNVQNTAYFGTGSGASGASYTQTDFQFGASQMMVEGRPVILTIWDALGTDILDASDLTTGVTISLVPGTFSTIGSIPDNVALAETVTVRGTVINYVENAAGGSAGDSLTGNAAVNILEGRAGGDVLIGGGGGDTLLGGTDRDEYRGTLSHLNGDVFGDYEAGESIIVTNAAVQLSQITITNGSTTVSIDVNGDGRAESTFTLQGTFSLGDLDITALTPTSTALTFGGTYAPLAPSLPGLGEGTALTAAQINGMFAEDLFVGDGAREFVVTLNAALSQAANRNALGVYEVDAAGNIVDVRIIVPDATSAPSAQVTVDGVEAGNELGFFLVQDGASWASGLGASDTLSFVNITGSPANISAGSAIALAVNGTQTQETVFHNLSQNLNSDGQTHVVSGALSGNNDVVIGFEDLTGGGDLDYQDLVFSVGVTGGTMTRTAEDSMDWI